MQKIHLGVIGTGDRGIGYLCKEFTRLAQAGRIVITGVADINPVRAQEGQRDLGARQAFTDYRELLAQPDLEAVFVMTPEFVHAPICVAALEAGKHVYCEKPMANTLAGCNQILQAAQRSPAIFFAGHNVRFGAVGQTIHRLIKEGRIGRVHLVWARRFVEGAKYWHRWHRQQENSGGLLVHKGCHYLDQMNWNAGGRPAYVSAFGALDVYQPRPDAPARCAECRQHCEHYLDLQANERQARYFLNAEKADGYIRDQCVFAPGSTVFDNAVVAIQYDNGVKGTYMECHFAAISDFDTERGAAGDEGVIIGLRTAPKTFQIRLESRKTHTVEYVEPDALGTFGDAAAIQAFLDCIAKGQRPESGAQAGWDSAVAGLAAQQSAATRKVARISPAAGTIELI